MNETQSSGTEQQQISSQVEEHLLDNIIVHDSQPSSPQEPLLARKPAKRRAVWSPISPDTSEVLIPTSSIDIPTNISFASAPGATSNEHQ
ncbi:unnamed protein product [Didymodactylos carnosus]|uniref:Uncharacterized protein n=1 Tax=Didymodactylos carnosus TaxID=1234261 RepID=A0A815AP44_9BILA|nr:unnamed protein product [Didymodactylos carnosus]CAF1395707.1 unnamed protein product [Didymodactylos carnosus]CAF4041490.1 unnamed protein product [Didymodactylos carnosus]CAF4203131.1 unnamed protein product [Didymodactylos carnosus]